MKSRSIIRKAIKKFKQLYLAFVLLWSTREVAEKINYIESINMYERCLETSSFEFAAMFTYFKAFQAFNKLKHREIGHS